MAGIDMTRLTAPASSKAQSLKAGSAPAPSKAKEASGSDFASMMQGKADEVSSEGTQKQDAPVKEPAQDAQKKPAGKQDKKDAAPVEESGDSSGAMQELQAALGQMMVQTAAEDADEIPQLVLEGVAEQEPETVEGLQNLQAAQTEIPEEAAPVAQEGRTADMIQQMPAAPSVQTQGRTQTQEKGLEPVKMEAAKPESPAVKEKSHESLHAQRVSADRGQDTVKTDIPLQAKASGGNQEDGTRGEEGRMGDAEADIQKMAAADMTAAGRPQDVFTVNEPQGRAEVLKTTPDTFGYDVGSRLASSLPKSNGTLTIELEPASLGKLTIRVVYEAGKAAVSILSANPRTVELLSQRAGEIARILEEKTGQDTVVYTPEQKQPFDEGQDSRERGQQRQEQRENQDKRNQSESFTQMLRLGLV